MSDATLSIALDRARDLAEDGLSLGKIVGGGRDGQKAAVAALDDMVLIVAVRDDGRVMVRSAIPFDYMVSALHSIAEGFADGNGVNVTEGMSQIEAFLRNDGGEE